MAYTPIDKPTDYFNTVTWNGDDTSPKNITGVGFQPDWIWGKARSRVGNHWLIDSVRGSTGSLYRVLNSDDTASEQTTNNGGTTAYGIVTTIGSDGFTVADGNSGDLNVNNSGDTYVSWNWKAGGTASSNSDGSITSSVSANTTSGFSIVSYTGNGSANQTVGHGLSQKPDIIFYKDRTGANAWRVIPTFINDGYYLALNTSGAIVSASTSYFGTTTSSVLGISGSNSGINNTSGNSLIAYCFAEKKGYSKFGSYTGNGNADGTFVYTGMKSSFIMVKRTDSAVNWRLFDNKRIGYNPNNYFLFPSLSNAEDTETGVIDFLSNGVKFRNTSSGNNASGGTYIYMAFAENPFVTSTGIPTTAR